MKILVVVDQGEDLSAARTFANDLLGDIKDHKATGFPPEYDTQIYVSLHTPLLTRIEGHTLIGEVKAK